MKHARNDYGRIQDLAEICQFMLEKADDHDNKKRLEAAGALRDMVAHLEKHFGFKVGKTEPIPANEPVFLLRAKDMVAPEVVIFWAGSAMEAQADRDITVAAIQQANKMREWQKEYGKQIPDMPKEMEMETSPYFMCKNCQMTFLSEELTSDGLCRTCADSQE